MKLGDLLAQTRPEDLLKFGLIPEFVGRLPVIATLGELGEDSLVRILTEPKNALVKQFQKLFEMEGVKLRLHGQRPFRLSPKALWIANQAPGACALSWKRPCWISSTRFLPWKTSRNAS